MNKRLIPKILLCSWSIGLGFRFINEFGNVYVVIMSDLLFDWAGLMLLGIVNLAMLTHDMIKGRFDGSN